ncbi:hypothetical protein [Pantoea sp. LMR881]|nr:hypothetical protein [Pantoea sp. LMR881]
MLAVQILPERVAAIIIEPVQGDGGFGLCRTRLFMQALRFSSLSSMAFC